MITFWTLIIMLGVACCNSWVAIIGVERREKEGMRLWANDEGYYIPWFLGYEGFYRGLFINVGFAGTSLAVTAVTLSGNPTYLGREAMVVFAVISLASGAVVACLIPSDFSQVVIPLSRKFWRLLVVGIVAVILYLVLGQYMCWYSSSIKLP